MRIGLISDTHIPEAAQAIPPQVLEVFKGVDLILHAGDIFISSVLDELQAIAPVLAARGDDDYQLKDERVQEVQYLTLEGMTLFLTHSSQYWARNLIEHPEKHGLEKAPDIVVFGHTHRDTVMTVGKSLLVNPGSATFPNYQLRLGTVALLDINTGKAKVRIIELKDVS
ncbi:MAG TPA: metallophosphoesterase family protein [Dehalococcoidia bacterium]|nr:metallophosphoesterase family protein [Dehalococcoidia bacterium]